MRATTTFLLICFVLSLTHQSQAGSSGVAVDAGFPPTPGNMVFYDQAHLFPAFSNVNLANTTGVGSIWFPPPAALKGNRWFEANFLFEYAGNPDPLGMSFHYGPRVDGDYRGGHSNGLQNGTPFWNEGLTVTIEAQDSPGHPEGVEVWYGQTKIGSASVSYSRNFTYPIEIKVFEDSNGSAVINVVFNNQLISDLNLTLPNWPSAAQIANNNWEFGFSGQGGYSDERGTWSGATIFVDSVNILSASSSTTRGKVQLPDGTGIAGAAVSRVHGGSILESTISQSDGTFVFSTFQSERIYQTISASKPGYNFTAQQNVMDGTDNLVFIPTSMPAPTLNQPANLVLNEDQTMDVNLTGIGATADPGYPATFTVTATSSDPSIVPHPTVNYTSAHADGTLNIAPIPNRSGMANITVQVEFTGNPQTVSKTFTVTVNPVNDPPFAGDGSSVSFNGTSNQEIRIPHNNALNALPLTVEFWVQTSDTTSFNGLINKYIDGSLNGWSIHLYSGSLHVWNYNTGAYVDFDAGFIANGAWRHVAVTFDSSGAKAYIGGTLTASASWSSPNPAAPTSTSDLHLGFYGSGYTDSALNGKLREVRIWSASRTVYEFNSTRNSSLAGNEANLVGYWKLNEETGLTANDSTANNFDGTLINGPIWNGYSGPLDEDTPKNIHLFGYDEEGAGLTYSIVTPPANGTLTGTGAVRTYLPNPNYHGNDSFTFKVNDGVSDSSIVTVPLTINSINDPPVAGSNLALRFDGVDDYADLNGVDLANKSFSIEFWARNNQPGNIQILLSQGAGAVDQGLVIGWRSNNVFTFAFWGDDLDSPAFPDTDWHHWACTFDVATREQRIYRDGVQVASRIAKGNYQGQGVMKLGHHIMGSSYHQVDLDELRIWTGVRSAQQIAGNQFLSLTGNEPNLVVNAPMDEGANSIINDFSALEGTQNGALIDGVQWIQSNRTGSTLVSNEIDVPEGGSIEIKMPGFDADGDPLTYNITGPTNGSLVGTGSSRTYTPTSPTFNGTDLITYTVTDSQGATSVPTTIAITVSPINNPPVFIGEPPILNQVIVESTFDNIVDHEIAFSIQDVDDADGTLIVVARSLDTSLVDHANLLILPENPTDGNRVLRYRSTPGESGTVRLFLTVIDAAGATDETFFDLRIEPQPAYAIIDIGSLTGQSHSFGRGINEDGVVAGISSFNSGGTLRQGSRALLFHGIENGSRLEDIGLLSGDIGSAAYAINDAGIIVGASLGSTSTRRSFIHDGLSMSELTVNLGGTGSEARDINQDEWITGYGNNASQKPLAFLREANASPAAIPMVSPYDDQSRGLSLNDHGVVVGEVFDGSGHKRAFHYDAATTTTTLLPTPVGSLQFDGAPNHHVTIAHDAAFNTVPFTVEFWFRTTQSTGNHGILGKYVDGSLNGWFFLITEGRLRVAYFAQGGNLSMDYTTATSLADGDWHHVALTVGANDFKVYLDGVEDHSENSGANPIVAGSSTAQLLLGAPIMNYASLQGNLSEVRIWSSERSATEIDNTKNIALNGNESNLLGYWRLNDGDGIVAFDSTSSNLSGSLSEGLDWEWHDTNELPVFANAAAASINNQGIVAGTFALDSSRTRGFLMSSSETVTLGTLPNDVASEATDVNEFGQTVGTSRGSNLSRATVYSAGTLYDLNALIPSGSGWTLEQANAINDRGEITSPYLQSTRSRVSGIQSQRGTRFDDRGYGVCPAGESSEQSQSLSFGTFCPPEIS